MGFIIFASLVGIVIGGMMCIPASRRQSGKLIAGGSFAVFAMCFVAVGIKPPSNANAAPSGQTAISDASQTTPAAAVAAAPRKLTKAEMIGQFRIRALSWSKEGFGGVMVANFTIHNDNTIDAKDIKITCSSSGLSNTTIDTNTRTVFEVVKERSYSQVRELNMGFIRGEVADTKCKVVDFTAA
jgi:hypothetical protein